MKTTFIESNKRRKTMTQSKKQRNNSNVNHGSNIQNSNKSSVRGTDVIVIAHHLSMDTWLWICTQLYFSPVHVFRVMAASREAWNSLKANPHWWSMFYQRIVEYQSSIVMHSMSPYIKTLQRYSQYPDKKRLLKLTFVRVCEICGAKQGHTLLHPLMSRLCTLCVQQRLISNRVLLKRYGIHFSDFLIKYHRAGGVVITHRQNHKRSLDNSTSLLWLTCDPLDFQTCQLDRMTDFQNQLLFFVIKDVERVREISLGKEAIAHELRLKAVERIGAECRMKNAQRTMRNPYFTVQDILVNDRYNRIQFGLRQQNSERGRTSMMMMLIMGGPFMFSSKSSSIGRNSTFWGLQQPQIRLRPGLTEEDLIQIRTIVDNASTL